MIGGRGLALVSGAVFLALRHRQFRAPILAYAILFSSTANVLFPIGTIMGERLVYAPSMGLALLLAILLARSRHWKTVLVAVALLFSVRTAVRNLDWLNVERFYTNMAETSPNSAKAQFDLGETRMEKYDDYVGAIEAFDRALAIMPMYSKPYCDRELSLAQLGRIDGAIAMHDCSYILQYSPRYSLDANGVHFW